MGDDAAGSEGDVVVWLWVRWSLLDCCCLLGIQRRRRGLGMIVVVVVLVGILAEDLLKFLHVCVCDAMRLCPRG